MNKETSSLINFHNLSVELRRLKRGTYSISTASLLINQSISQTTDYSALLQHPDCQKLLNLCKIICYRFSVDPSLEIINLVSLLRFTFGPQQIGPFILLRTLFSIYHTSLNENCLKALNRFDPIFLEKYLLGGIYSNPKDLLTSTSEELFLPLQIPNLSKLSIHDRNNLSLLQYLIHYSSSRSYAHIVECATNETLFEPFSNFVYQHPEFFIVANQIFKKKQLFDVLLKLKNKNPSSLLNSYLSIYYNTSAELVELFLNLYNDEDMLKYVGDDHIQDLYNFFQSNSKWDSISLLYQRDQKSHDILYSIFQSTFIEDQRKYLSRYPSIKCDFLIEAIEPLILSKQVKLDPKYFIFLLPNDQISLKMLQIEPRFLQSILECSVKKDEAQKKTINQITTFINRNLKQFLEMQNISLQLAIFNEESIINNILNIDELSFFDIFEGSEQNQILIEASIIFISFITQSMNQGMNPTPSMRPPEPFRDPPRHRQSQQGVKFPSKNFFDKLVEKVDVNLVLSNVYKMNQELMRIVEWRKALVATPKLLFSTIEIKSQEQQISDSNELINLFQKYIQNNYDLFSRNSNEFLTLINFFLNKKLLDVLPQFMFENLSLSIRLSLLECFANCSHIIFENEPEIDLKTVDLFVSFFNLLSSTNVFSIASPANDLLCRDFVLPLIRIPQYENIVPQMMISLNVSPPQPLTAISSSFSDVAQNPDIENIDIELGSTIDQQSFDFIVNFLRNSMPEPQIIDQMLHADMVTIKKLTDLSIKVLSHIDCNLWMDSKFISSLVSIFNKLDDFDVTPRFLQALAFYVNRYCVGNEMDPLMAHPDISPDLLINYQCLAQFSMRNRCFDNVLMELLQ